MRTIVAAVAAILASLATFVWKVIKVAGQSVLALVREPAPPQAAPSPAVQSVIDADDNIVSKPEFASALSLRKILKAHLAGERPDPAAVLQLPVLTVRWLRQLEQKQCQSLLNADDKSLENHLRGRQTIKGVYHHDEATVAELERVAAASVEAKLAERVAVRKRSREPEAVSFAA